MNKSNETCPIKQSRCVNQRPRKGTATSAKPDLDQETNVKCKQRKTAIVGREVLGVSRTLTLRSTDHGEAENYLSYLLRSDLRMQHLRKLTGDFFKTGMPKSSLKTKSSAKM